MDAQELLEQLLASGKQIASKGKELVDEGADYASKYIEIPEAGPERDELLKKVGAGVAATQYSVLSTQYPVPSTQYSVLRTPYSVPT